MRPKHTVVLLGGLVLGVAGSALVGLRAQVQSDPKDQRPTSSDVPSSTAKATGSAIPQSALVGEGSASANVLVQMYRFPFAQPTSLEAVRAHLQTTLKIQVVLDLAALNRQALTPDDTVQLELERVRLKTGLQLLLDQVGLTYRIIPEDNLLVLTDKQGSDDPLTRIWAEIRELHRDIHTVQDSIDDLTDLLIPEGADLQLRKPTIIEEMPESRNSLEKPEQKGVRSEPIPGEVNEPLPSPHQPGRRSGGRLRPVPPPSNNIEPAEDPPQPARVPLGRPRKRT